MRKRSKIKVSDTGLRGRFNGELYIDKKVFFKRDDVQKVIISLKNSRSLEKHIEDNRHSLKLT